MRRLGARPGRFACSGREAPRARLHPRRRDRAAAARVVVQHPPQPIPGPARAGGRRAGLSPRRMNGETLALGPGAEFDLIRQLRERWGSLAPRLGDDAAVLQIPRGEQLVVSTDAALEGVHFRLDWLSHREIGYRAVTAALSDLAAMAAVPRGVLLSLQLSADAREHLLELADGIADAVRAVDTVVVGGNLARGDLLGITTTVLGAAYAPLGRGGAQPGNLLYATGLLGGPRAALRALESGRTPDPHLRERFAHPTARVAEARWLVTRG